MDAKELRHIGEQLSAADPDKYRRGWITALAKEIEVIPRTVHHWLAEDKVPAPMAKLIRFVAAEYGIE